MCQKSKRLNVHIRRYSSQSIVHLKGKFKMQTLAFPWWHQAEWVPAAFQIKPSRAKSLRKETGSDDADLGC